VDNELGHTLGVLANLCKTRASLAFVTDFGLFEWVRMPFGLKCASNSFIRALQQLLFPKKEVRQILGLFSYFRTYIDRFPEIAKPLTDLTRKQVSSKISWTSEHQHAFDLLKQSLCNVTKLHTFEFGKPCGLLVYASNIAVGVLSDTVD